MKFVLDSSAFLSGKNLVTDKIDCYTTYSVINELESKQMKGTVELLFEIGLKVLDPSEDSRNRVKENAQATGDIARLSNTDIDILALALELNATIVTDDYSIQNIAEVAGIKYLPLAQKGIEKKIFWKYRCRGCGKYFSTFVPTCTICGSKVRTVR